MPKHMVVTVSGNHAEVKEPRLIQHAAVQLVKPKQGSSEIWTLSNGDNSCSEYRRGQYVRHPHMAETYLTVIDMEFPYDIAQAISNAIKLNQHILQQALGLKR